MSIEPQRGRRSHAAVAAVFFASAALPGCSEPLEFAPWTLPVPDGTAVIEYADVVESARTEVIELAPDLVVGGGDDPDASFYGYPDFAVAADGRIYVLDTGNDRVQVYAADGRHLQTIGGRGQGPEELDRARAIAVTQDAVVVNDRGNGRFNSWGLDGLHQGVHPRISGRDLHWFHPLGGGSFAGRFYVLSPQGVRHEAVLRFSLSNGELHRYAERPESPDLTSKTRSLSLSVPGPSLAYTLADAGGVYVTDREHYQVLKFDARGELVWALRTDREPQAFPETEIERRLESMRRLAPDVTRAEFDWPDLPALQGITSDAAGRLYVFPYVARPATGDAVEQRRVDVYTADGERIFTGWLQGGGSNLWSAARGEHVYVVDQSEAGEFQVVRYRMLAPFR